MQGGQALLPHEEQLIPGCVRYSLEFDALGGQPAGGGRMGPSMGGVGSMSMERGDGLRSMDGAQMGGVDRNVDSMIDSSEMESAGFMPPLNPPVSIALALHAPTAEVSCAF